MSPSENRPSLILKILVWLSAICILFGESFKILHLPGAAPLMLFGTFSFSFFYLPLYAIESWKTEAGLKSKLILLSQLVVLMLFSVGFLFKIMHWPGSGPLYYLNYSILFIVVLPYALNQLRKATKSSLNRSHHLLIAIYFLGLCFGSLMNMGGGRINVDTILQQCLNTQEALKAASSRNKQLYQTLNSFVSDKAAGLVAKTTKLNTLTDSAYNHIKQLKSQLLIAADNLNPAQADTLNLANILNKANSEIPTRLMIGNEYSPNRDRYSASQLKSVINSFRDSVVNLVNEQNRAILKEGLNLNTGNYTSEEGTPVSWEMGNFYNMPLLYVYNTLTSLQYEIKNAEYQVLTNLINSGNNELNTALFTKLSNLNARFAEAKKQEQINQLQNENKKGMELLNAKDYELSNTRQTIILFVVILMAFIVLVFFVIRSNYLRRQTNRALVQQKQIIEQQKTEVEAQKHLVEEKQKEIIESISYAKRLQEAILPPQAYINKHLPSNFILYKPKDIVAGDFYWAERINDMFFIAAADSTGHGVPGAMVSVVCSNALNRTIKEFNITEPGKILDKTRELVLQTFEKSGSDVKDGMDISLLCINLKTKQASWSGANNPLWYVQNNQLIEIKADKQPIGKTEYPKPFTTHEINYVAGTSFYLFTDGFADQFGGPDGKKFKYKQFANLLVNQIDLSQQEQLYAINMAFDAWKGDLEQVDDVCVIGIKL